MQKVIMLLMTTLLWLPLNAKVWNGTRNTDWYDDSRNYFEISTAEELAGLAELVNAGNAFNNKTIKLMADIVLNEDVLDEDGNLNRGNAFKEWTPIGLLNEGRYDDDILAFSGTFDGNGYVIYGLYIPDNREFPYKKGGLFSAISSIGMVKNLGMEDGYVENAGNICYSNGGNIERCYSKNTVISFIHSMSDDGGGICIINEFTGQISNCSNSGNIISTEEVTLLGGICSTNVGEIINSYNSGTINGLGGYVGGVCGENKGNIIECYNTGKIVDGSVVAGICYSNIGQIIDCYNESDIYNDNESRMIAGICAINDGYSDSRLAKISNCVNYGKIEAVGAYAEGAGICVNNGKLQQIIDCRNEGEIMGSEKSYFIGGVCGYNDGSISYCYNTAQILEGSNEVGGICASSLGEISNCHNLGDINISMSSGSVVGGICGSGNVVRECYNIGNITIDEANLSDIIGGICGTMSNRIENCYNTGNIMNRKNTILDDIGDVLGGICASFNYSDGLIENCYNIGNIVSRRMALSPYDSGDKVGGIAGKAMGIVNCFNMGVVTGIDVDTNIGSICGVGRGIKGCFYLKGTYAKGVGFYEITQEEHQTGLGDDYLPKEVSGSEMIDILNSLGGWLSSVYSDGNTIYLPTLGDEEPPTLTWNITANESISTAMKDDIAKVYTQNGNLYIYTSQPQAVAIITMNGTVLKRKQQEGLRSYSLPKGVYIICIGEERMKVRL